MLLNKRRRGPGVLPAFFLLLLGCGLLRFRVEEQDKSRIEGAGLVGELLGTLDLGGLDDFDTSIDGELADQGVEPGDLESVVIDQLDLHAEPDLSFIGAMEIYVKADGVPEVLVAHGDDFPPGQADISLELTGAELVDAVVAGGMEFRVEVTGSAPAEDVELLTTVGVEIEATAQGACNQSR